MSSAAALTDILRFLNTHDFKRGSITQKADDGYGDLDPEQLPLQIFNDAIVARYASLRLGSDFQSIVGLDGGFIGYKAQATAFSSNVSDYHFLDIAKLLPSAGDRSELVYLDRLTRTVHALNYLASELQGDLHLSVNPQHLLEVHENHGQVFESILAKCGLQPDQIVLEIAEHAVSDKRHLKTAIAGWKKRCYRIAFDDFGVNFQRANRALSLQPDIIKFDSDFVARMSVTLNSRHRLEAMLADVHAAGIQTIVTAVDSEILYDTVQMFPFLAVQGCWHPESRLNHSLQRIA